MIVQFWLIDSSGTKFILISTSPCEFLSVWYQHDCFFFDECLHEKLLFVYFDKKENESIVSVFHQPTSCLLRLHCQLDWQDWRSFCCSYLYQSFNWFIRIAWVYWETHFNIFFQINEFLQRNTQFQRNKLKLWSSSPTEPRFHKDCRLHCYVQYCTRSPTTWYVDNW